MLKILDLRVENEKNPLLVGTPDPRFGWKLESDRSGTVQASYRIQVSADSGFRAVLRDTGRVESSRSQFVGCPGAAFAPRSRCWVRVSVSDGFGRESGWSESGWFETAGEAWTPEFITAVSEEASSSRSVRLRKEFSVTGRIVKARAYATALGLYELSLNGKRIGDAVLTPGWTNYRRRLQYQAYDVTALVREGVNAVGAELGAGWFKGNLTWLKARNFYGELSAFSLLLVLTDEEGRETAVTTDGTWKAAPGPVLYSELYHGETYDARLEEPGWNTPGFRDDTWMKVKKVDFDPSHIVPQDGPPVKRRERLAPVSLTRTPKGELVLDFGQNLTGWVAFSVSGRRGDRVVLHHAETLDAKGNFYTKNLRSAKQRIEYVLSGEGSEIYEPRFSFQGFRYVRIEEYPGTPEPSSFEAVVVHSEMEPAFEFECSNGLLNRLHHNILWGWKGNAVDIPTDCPQRDERLGWTGDAQVFIGTASYLMDVYTFFRKWLRDLASEQLPDGGVPFVIPDVLAFIVGKDKNIRDSHSSTGWGDAAVICPWTTFERYGDGDLLAEHYPMMKAWVDFIRGRAAGGLLWNSGFHFGDWVALDAKEGSYFGATPNDLTATAYYAYSAELVARAAEALGKTEDAAAYRTLHGEIVKAFRKEFYTPGGRLAARTQTAHILSLVFNLAPAEHRERTVNDLVSLIGENGGHLTTGFLGTPYICRALAENGRLDAAYELLLKEDYPSWLYQVTMGATTVWEHWDGLKPGGKMWSPKMNSFNHYAYGAVGEWVYRTAGGIGPDPEVPGFRSFVLSPRPGGGIRWCRTAYRSLYGTIRVEWSIESGVFRMEAEIPANTTARIVLPGVAGPVECTGNLKFTEYSGTLSACAGSGTYTIRYPVP